ncbi:MAG: ABC transporter ATP-binding protein, partial [Candidatus Neomarinimicrobiota bacterium]
MNEIAIKVENLSKRYRIGLKEKTEDTFVGAVGSILKSPLQNFKRLQRLTNLNDSQENSEDIIWA